MQISSGKVNVRELKAYRAKFIERSRRLASNQFCAYDGSVCIELLTKKKLQQIIATVEKVCVWLVRSIL